MARNITIVTGFFDIGRSHVSNNEYSRNNRQYFEHFDFWARIKNHVVVYTEPQNVDTIMEIRQKYGMGDRTTIIPIADIFSVEPLLYRRMSVVANRPEFSNYRYVTNAMSNKANYDYIMLIKYWCMSDACSHGLVSDFAAWLDFGFNHGGECFTNPNEFDFLWDYDFTSKIHVFSHKDPNNEFSLRNLQLQTDCFHGAPVLAPRSLCGQLWDMIRTSMEALLMLDSIDDDQQLMLMAYRSHPELFEVHISDWFLPLKTYGNPLLTTKPKSTIVAEPAIKALLREILGRTPDQRFSKRMLTCARDARRS